MICPSQKFGVEVPLYDNSDKTKKDTKLNKYSSEILAQRRLWKQPNEKKEPITGAMLDRMWADLQRADLNENDSHLSLLFAAFDWLRLGCFTGSRISYYGQDTLRRGELFARIPNSSDVPEEWRGMPLAFGYDDFKFWDANFVEL